MWDLLPTGRKFITMTNLNFVAVASILRWTGGKGEGSSVEPVPKEERGRCELGSTPYPTLYHQAHSPPPDSEIMPWGSGKVF